MSDALKHLVGVITRSGADTVKYSRSSTFDAGLVYAAAWSDEKQQGFGGCILTDAEFDKLRARVTQCSFVRVDNGD